MSTPPRIRGLVDKFESAVKKYCHAKWVDKPMRRQEMLTARMDVLRAFALVAGAPKSDAKAWRVPEVSGIGRDAEHPRAVVLYLRKEPTDDDMRAIQDGLRSLAAAPQPVGGADHE